MFDKLNQLIDLKKWIEGHIVAGVAAATTAAAGLLAAHHVLETLAKFGVTVTIDPVKFKESVLIGIAGVAGVLWNVVRKKTATSANPTQPQ